MKITLAIAALLGSSNAIQLNDSFSQMSQNDLHALAEKKMSQAISAAASPEDAKKQDAELKAIGEALGKSVTDRLNVYGVPYGYPMYPYVPYTSPYYSDIVGIVNSANAYNDYVHRYEVANAIAGYYSPSYDAIVGALKNATAKDPVAPAASLLQTEGVPVYVNPTLRPNDIGISDLDQRDIVIDGVNGYDYVQTSVEKDVPVLVHPESMIIANTEAATNLGFVDMMIGPDEVSAVQLEKDVKVLVHPESMIIANTEATTDLGLVDMEIGPDEVSAVQVQRDVPVLVHPESMIIANTEAATNLGFVDMELGPDEVSFLLQQHHNFLEAQRPDEVTVLQVNGVPVLVHPESMIIANTQAATNLGLVDMEMGPDEVSAIQVQKDLKKIDDEDMAGALDGFNQLIQKINTKYVKK